jgi:hypothetical protein
MVSVTCVAVCGCLLTAGWVSAATEKQPGAGELAERIAEMKELLKASGGQAGDERMALGAIVDYVPAEKRRPMPPLSPKLRTAAEFAM